MTTGWWFTFNQKTNNELNPIITDLADKFSGGDTFIPHLSIYTYVDCSSIDIQQISTDLTSMIKPFSLNTIKISHEEPVHKTLFIECEMCDSLKMAYEYMENRFKQNFEFQPHISLTYASHMPVKDRKKLAQSIKIPQQINIDAISYYNPSGKMSAKFFTEWPKPTKVKLQG